MTNLTVQQILNNGYAPASQANLLIPNAATAITDPGVNVNAISIKNAADISGGIFLWIGGSSVSSANGFPLFDYNGAGQLSNTKEFFIITRSPASWYLISNFALGVNVRVLYYTLIST